MWFQDLFNIDLTAIKMSSTLVATNTRDGEISFCAYNAAGWRTLVEDLNEKVQLPEWHSRHGRHAIFANGKLVNIAGVADSAMAEKLSFVAGAGHPCGVGFDAKKHMQEHPDQAWQAPLLEDVKANAWTVVAATR
jgi:hypothetical protein